MKTLPDDLADKIFMEQALRQANLAIDHDEVPVGAVITRHNEIIAKAHNQVETLKDPTAHAEMIAITQAVSTIKSKWLEGCTIYVTLEPCCMCAGALVLTRVKRLVYATADPKAGACGSVANIAAHNKLNHRIEIKKGLLSAESAKLLSGFFKDKRVKKQVLAREKRLAN